MKGRGLTVLAALAVCVGCDHVPQDAIQSCQDRVQVLPARTDILVVVDDSGSMLAEQELLRENLDTFVNALAASPIPLDFQIGVTTTSVLDYDGFTAAYPWWLGPFLDYSYTVPYPRGALVAVDPAALTDPTKIGKILYDPKSGFTGTRILVTESPTLVPDFESNVLVGTLGSAKEQPFHATELALTDRVADGTNAGFLRPGARLGLIVLTDEDDCSEWTLPFLATSEDTCHSPSIKAQLTPPSAFLDFLEGEIAGEERDPVVAVIAGFDRDTLAPTGCATSSDAPTRLAALVDAMGPNRALRSSICDPTFGPALLQIADLLVPQSVPLDGAPPDLHMLVAAVDKADGSRVSCSIAAEGDPASAQAGAVYAPPQGGRPPTLTFQNACRLAAGDHLELSIICAR